MAGYVAIPVVGCLAACGTAPGSAPSPATSATPAPTFTPTASPSPSPTPSIPAGWAAYTRATQKVALGLPGAAPPLGITLISTNPSLYGSVQTTTINVNGVTGMRVAGDQTSGQGSGTSQLEYDLETGGRTYYVLAIVGGITGTRTATAAQVDQFVATFTLGA